MIAALFVETDGVYFHTDGIDPWDIRRDARLYNGPHPVIAHPPCERWCQLASLNERLYGHKIGDDGGCFESALNAVRQFTGVLEHPAYSKAWERYGLPKPKKAGGWVQGACGGFSCYVEQGNYGNAARKPTWLYAYGIDPLPEMRWGTGPKGKAVVSWLNNRGLEKDSRRRISKREASQTTFEFRDTLINLVSKNF